MAKRVRAFFAVQPDEKGIDFLNERIQLLRGRGWERFARFVQAGDLHVTLRFLGEIEPGTLETLRARGAEIAAATPPFEYTMGRSVLFPRVSRARVIATEVATPSAMRGLVRKLEDAAVEAGLEAEKWGFKGHVTLARLKHGDANRPNVPQKPGESVQRATQLLLLETIGSAEGNQYAVIESFPFQGVAREEDEEE